MNTKLTRATPAMDLAEQWRRAVQGNAEARRTLLERIMSRRSSRTNTPRLHSVTRS